MNRREAARAFAELARSPAAGWIGNRREDGIWRKKCMRCGVEETIVFPAMGVTSPVQVSTADEDPDVLDEQLFLWMRAFQRAHEGCAESGSTSGDGQREPGRSDALAETKMIRILTCATHGVRRWQGHLMCEWCGQIYQSDHGTRRGDAPDVCGCGRSLLPPVEARTGDVLGLGIAGVTVDDTGHRIETSYATMWTGRPICYLCFRRFKKDHGGRVPVERDRN